MKLGDGGQFKKISGKIEKNYESKGYDANKAAKIADATASSIGRAKYGKKKMASMASKGRKK